MNGASGSAPRKPSNDPPQPFNGKLPAIPVHLLKEAMAIAKPVTESDEPVLIEEIIRGLRKGRNHKDILNSMHGKNMHSVSIWKDYYLEHKIRLDSVVRKRMKAEPADEASGASHQREGYSEERDKGPVHPPVQKMSPASFRLGSSSARSSPASTSTVPAKRGRPKAKSPARKESTPVAMLSQATGSRRATLNSLTAPAPVFDSRLPPPNAEVKIPEPPSRSPSPPTRIVPGARGNRYTDEDREFFIKFIQRELEKDPSLTRVELCERIAIKAPHHTAASWASHWSNNHDLPDKILTAAHSKLYPTTTRSEENPRPIAKRPKYSELSSDEEDEGDDDAMDCYFPGADQGEDESDGEPLIHWKEEDMGKGGGPFTEADAYIAAKYIANYPNWEHAKKTERWQPLTEKYTERSYKSWAEWFRREQKKVMRIVRKIQKEDSRSQRAHPSGAPPGLRRF